MLTFRHLAIKPTHAPLQRIRHLAHKPTHANLHFPQYELYTDAHAIHSTKGGGAHGHLAIIMPPADHLNQLGQAFDVPIHPGTAPKHITHKAI